MNIDKVIWTDETDVIVVGYGASGTVAAINARDQGAEVLLIEKGDRPGGSSILAGGAIRVSKNVEKTVEYLTHTQGNRVSEKLIQVFAQGLYEIPSYLEELGQINGAKIALWEEGPVNLGAFVYPFPGAESLYTAYVQDIPGFRGFDWINGFGVNFFAQRLIKILVDNVEKRRVRVYFNTPAVSLITDHDGVVRGVEAIQGEKRVFIKAGKGVILASGGFSFNEKLKKEYLELTPVYAMGNPGITGDGILMAQKAGAALWHMWHFHGSYGFKFDDYEPAIRIVIRGRRSGESKISWILLDQYGKRFMNECHPAPNDSMHRNLEFFDPLLPGYPRIPAIMIFDENGRKLGRIGDPIAAIKKHKLNWSSDNSAEIERGWIRKYDSPEALALGEKLDVLSVSQSIERWNSLVALGEDTDFHRPMSTAVRIEKAPFYAVEVWPICTNTQGGPEHDEKQRILDPYGVPIPHLYAAGELGSFFGHLYLQAGNLGECFVGGRIAGKEAACGAE
jgi:succinate dehydrogenase/fumarate reductase flavoprotein subunit